MRILVTGGCGFIGATVCRRLIAGGAVVLNLDIQTYAASPASLGEAAASDRYTHRAVDITDASAVKAAFAGFEPQAVLHLAAETHVDRSIVGPDAFVHTNVVGTLTLLEAARVFRDSLAVDEAVAFRFVHVSTDEVYGSLGPDGLFNEDSAYDPRSPYSASKAGSDHLARAWFHTYGLPVIVTNCSNNYGPRQFPEKLIPLMILNGLQGRDLPVYGDGGQVRDWLHVEDHAMALERVLGAGRPGQTYVVGGRSERTNLQVVEAVCAALDHYAPAARPHAEQIRFVEDRPGHDRRYAIDPTRIETELGWRAEHDFDSGLDQTVRWYLDNRDWWERLRARYDAQRLGLPDRAVTG